MKTTNHTKLLQAICDLGDDFDSKKHLFSPEFYNDVHNCFSELEQIVARELFSLTGGLDNHQITPNVSSTPSQESALPTEDLVSTNEDTQKSLQEPFSEPSDWNDELETETAKDFTAVPPIPESIPAPEITTSEPKPTFANYLAEPIVSEPEPIFTPEPMTYAEIPTPPPAPTPVPVAPVVQPVQNEPVQKKEIVTKTGETEWRIPKNAIICQTHDILVKRGDIQSKIQFSISPLEKVLNGTVPILVNAEYTVFDMKQNSTSKTEGSDVLLLMEVDLFTFLIKGSFNNGVFEASIMSAERSIEAGDIIESLNIQSNGGTEPAPCIELQKESKLWISFNKSYFGINHSEEWIDELNDNHEVMVPVTSNGTENYEELRLTQTDKEWIIKL